MKKFAKLFDVGDHQLLVYIEQDDEHEQDGYSILHQITDTGSAVLDVAMRGPEAALLKVLDMYEQENAANFFSLDIVAKVMSLEAADA